MADRERYLFGVRSSKIISVAESNYAWTGLPLRPTHSWVKFPHFMSEEEV
jgi:hypothetical protein